MFSVSTHIMSRLSQNHMCPAHEGKAHAQPMELSHVPKLMLLGVMPKAQVFSTNLTKARLDGRSCFQNVAHASLRDLHLLLRISVSPQNGYLQSLLVSTSQSDVIVSLRMGRTHVPTPSFTNLLGPSTVPSRRPAPNIEPLRTYASICPQTKLCSAPSSQQVRSLPSHYALSLAKAPYHVHLSYQSAIFQPATHKTGFMPSQCALVVAMVKQDSTCMVPC